MGSEKRKEILGRVLCGGGASCPPAQGARSASFTNDRHSRKNVEKAPLLLGSPLKSILLFS
jgi:hypothetical protein